MNLKHDILENRAFLRHLIEQVATHCKNFSFYQLYVAIYLNLLDVWMKSLNRTGVRMFKLPSEAVLFRTSALSNSPVARYLCS